jgi:hypothetical protein
MTDLMKIIKELKEYDIGDDKWGNGYFFGIRKATDVLEAFVRELQKERKDESDGYEAALRRVIGKEADTQ